MKVSATAKCGNWGWESRGGVSLNLRTCQVRAHGEEKSSEDNTWRVLGCVCVCIHIYAYI